MLLRPVGLRKEAPPSCKTKWSNRGKGRRLRYSHIDIIIFWAPLICSIAIESNGLRKDIRQYQPGHFAAHGVRRGAATYVATASPPSLASLASLALGGRWSDYHSTQCRPSQQYTSNASIIIEAAPSVPRPTPALVTTLPYQRWQQQGHFAI